MIVSEVQFEENAVGSSSAVGQFVSAESKGGATGYGYVSSSLQYYHNPVQFKPFYFQRGNFMLGQVQNLVKLH